MNFREGFRRTGILLGILGACAGAVLTYATAPPAWRAWREHKKFESLLTTTTVRKATGASWFARHSPGKDKWKSCDDEPNGKWPQGYKTMGPCYETSAADKGRLHWTDDGVGATVWNGETTVMLRLESFAPQPNPDGIANIRYDANGSVTLLELATGDVLVKTPSPPYFVETLVPFSFPIIGFLLPWGVMKSISWVASGFTTSKAV
jgi:hypothetical protein